MSKDMNAFLGFLMLWLLTSLGFTLGWNACVVKVLPGVLTVDYLEAMGLVLLVWVVLFTPMYLFGSILAADKS